MSSSEDEAVAFRKRKVHRACDSCRTKKTRCDGPDQPDNKCTYCIAHDFECTYIEASKRRVTPKSYVEALESRVQSMSILLQKLVPDIDLHGNLLEMASSLDTERNMETEEESVEDDEKTRSDRGSRFIQTLRSIMAGPSIPPDTDLPAYALADDEDEVTVLTLTDTMRRFKVEDEYRFFGKSSALLLVHDVLGLQEGKYARRCLQNESNEPFKPPAHWHSMRRPEFWTTRPWERAHHIHPSTDLMPAYAAVCPLPPNNSDADSVRTYSRRGYTFPPHDLMLALVDLYFYYTNPFLPLLHKPTFLRKLAEGRHLQHDDFATVLLMVCAIGSRWSSDPRVLLDGETGWQSSGWKWFNQVQLITKSLLQTATLYDLQFYCLAITFMQTTSAPQACWFLIGIGIRLAQEVGAHRKKIHVPYPSSLQASHEERLRYARERMEDEEWTRAWWCLLCFDRMVSSGMGRPCAVLDEDFDVDLPLEVDDMYWEDPTGNNDSSRMFQQPKDSPSSISFFIQLIKLMKLVAFSLRTIYSISTSKWMQSCGVVKSELQPYLVAELDSAMNKWVDGLPQHLRWDPNNPDRQFFIQSVALRCHYSNLQILVHRPFITSNGKTSQMSYASLAMCTNVARSCAHMIDTHCRRILKEESEKKARGELSEGDAVAITSQPCTLYTAFSAGVILTLRIYGLRRSALNSPGNGEPDLSKDIAVVHKCMAILKLFEGRWPIAGRCHDILAELNVTHAPPPILLLPHDPPNSASYPDNVIPTEQPTPKPPSLAPYLTTLLSRLGQDMGEFQSTLPPYASVLTAFQSNYTEPPQYQEPTPSLGQPSWSDPIFNSDHIALDDNTMALWSNVPTGFELDDWAQYLDWGQKTER